MKTLLSVFIASALSCSVAAKAASLVDVEVIDRDTGTTLPTHASSGKYYVAGTPGHRYAVRMTNLTGGRVLTVLSVDGVNAVSGETANANQTGYVLDPYESTEIAGWRKSTEEIAQFNFTALSNSYAAKTGRPNNVGVIGVAVFRERVVRPRMQIDAEHTDNDGLAKREAPSSPPPVPTMEGRSPAGGSAPATTAQAETAAGPRDDIAQAHNRAETKSAAKPTESLGTGHGAREHAPVSYTDFVRESSRPNEIVSVYYDSYENLVARGIIRLPRRAPDPQPFPNQFVPDPDR